LEAIARFSQAWDYVALCHAAGIEHQTYDAWFKERTLHSLEWHRWLYGALPPDSCFVVTDGLQRLKTEGTPEAICAAAGIWSATYRQWQKDELLREALKRTIEAAARSGGHLPQPVGWEPWHQIHGKIKVHMGRSAQEATSTARCRRAVVSPSSYLRAIDEAARAGVAETLRQYLESHDLGRAEKSGLIADRFFVPSPGMLRFREAAEEAATDQGLKAFKELRNNPAFDQWLVDWTTPRKWKGERNVLPNSRPAPKPPTAAEEPKSRASHGGEETQPSTKHAGGRPIQNRALLSFATNLRRDDPTMSDKEVLKRFKQVEPSHPIFECHNPVGAFCTAQYRARTERIL
jgi:hypothetical protein